MSERVKLIAGLGVLATPGDIRFLDYITKGGETGTVTEWASGPSLEWRIIELDNGEGFVPAVPGVHYEVLS